MIDSSTRTRMNVEAPFENQLGKELHRTKNCLKAIYDFTTMGGVVGDIGLVDDDGNRAMLPAKAIVTRSYVEVKTAVTSGGSATVALKAVGAADLLAATAKASLTIGALLDGACDGTASKMVKVGASAVQVNATVAVAALTAGRIEVFVEYVLGE